MILFGVIIELVPKEGNSMDVAESLVRSLWELSGFRVVILFPDDIAPSDLRVDKLVAMLRRGLRRIELFDSEQAENELIEKRGEVFAAEFFTAKNMFEKMMAEADETKIVAIEGDRIVINLPLLPKDLHPIMPQLVVPWITHLTRQAFDLG